MGPDLLAVLCDPVTHDPLEVTTAADERGYPREALVNPRTGQRFAIRNDIPVFLDQAQVSGLNKRSQGWYDFWAPFYDLNGWLYARWKGWDLEALAREYLGDLEVKAGDRVLEVAVGTGRHLQILPRDARFFGLDISWGMLRRCQRKVARWSLDATLFLGTAERLPFRDAVFDAVLDFGAVNFINDRAAAICEMIRVAKPGARFAIADAREEFVRKYERLPGAGYFLGDFKVPMTPPVDLLPPEMQDVRVKDILGMAYCLVFRKPR